MTLPRVAARDKPRMAKWTLLTVLTIYLAVYLPLGLVTHARAYLAFVHHRAQAIPFALLAMSGSHPTVARPLHLRWYWPPWRLQAGHLARVSEWEVATGSEQQATIGLSAVWGPTPADKLAQHDFVFVSERLVWDSGNPLSGQPVLTRVATATGESHGLLEERWDPSQQKMVWAYVTLHSTLRHVYNREQVWFIYTAVASRRVDLRSDRELARNLLPVVLANRAFDELPRGTYPGQVTPESMPAVMEALATQAEHARQADLRAQPVSTLLGWVRGIDFRYAGLFWLTDSSLLPFLWTALLEIPTLPIRYLLFTPLALVPAWLVLPLALIYPLLLVVVVGWLARRHWPPAAYLWWYGLTFVNASAWFLSKSP